MSCVYLSRKIYFSCAHRYHNPEWSDQKNQEMFGPCNNPHGHGHNYELEVTLYGPVNTDTGMVMNLTDLDEILKKKIMLPLDHRHLNHEVSYFEKRIPTTEQISLFCWKEISESLKKPIQLHRVRLFENPELYVDYYGEELDT